MPISFQLCCDNTITWCCDSITVAGSGADGAGNIIDAGSGNDTVVMGTGAGDDTVTLGTGDDVLDARLTTTSTEKVVVTDFEDAGVTVGDTVILAQSLTTRDATGTPVIETEAVVEITADGDYELATALATNTNAIDIVVLTDLDGTHNLATDFTNENGAQLYLALATGGAVTTINVDNSGDEFYILAIVVVKRSYITLIQMQILRLLLPRLNRLFLRLTSGNICCGRLLTRLVLSMIKKLREFRLPFFYLFL